MYRKYFKRLFDFICSLLALIILSPVLLFITILVRIRLGSPVIFKQKRPGLHEKIFTLYKFRTMSDQKDEQGNLLPDEVRLTKFGKMLRSTSLDELPELWNVLKGDMSIIGPRPLLVEYLPYYKPEERHRHDVRPGITGLAQIKGRNYLLWEERFEKDLFYINNYSIALDIKTIIGTVLIVASRKDIADRTQIFTDIDGERYIIRDGQKFKYPKALHIERSIVIK